MEKTWKIKYKNQLKKQLMVRQMYPIRGSIQHRLWYMTRGKQRRRLERAPKHTQDKNHEVPEDEKNGILEN